MIPAKVEENEYLKNRVKIIGWTLVIVTTCQFFFIGFIYMDQADRYDLAKHPHTDPKQVTYVLYLVLGELFGNFLMFIISIVLIFAVYRKSLICFHIHIWLVVTTILTGGDTFVQVLLVLSTHFWLVYIMLLWNVLVAIMLIVVFRAYWNVRHHKSYDIEHPSNTK